MKEVSVEDFIDYYRPICNNCTPYPDGILKAIFGNVIWDKRDYNKLAVFLNSKMIWTILKDDINYYIRATVSIIPMEDKSLIGYIVTDVPYNTNDINELQVIIKNTDR